MIKKIGITMRVENALSYHEYRDCIAQDWIDYLSEFKSDIKWILIPNLGEKVTNYIKSWAIDCIIISGGNDIGEYHIRDKTENSIIEYAEKNNIPLLGVCRGLQLIQQYYGGVTEKVSALEHVAKSHLVKMNKKIFGENVGSEFRVNSFHNIGVPAKKLASELDVLAITDDGIVEAFKHKTKNIVAVQWHPERGKNKKQQKFDINMFLETFKL